MKFENKIIIQHPSVEPKKIPQQSFMYKPCLKGQAILPTLTSFIPNHGFKILNLPKQLNFAILKHLAHNLFKNS